METVTGQPEAEDALSRDTNSVSRVLRARALRWPSASVWQRLCEGLSIAGPDHGAALAVAEGGLDSFRVKSTPVPGVVSLSTEIGMVPAVSQGL